MDDVYDGPDRRKAAPSVETQVAVLSNEMKHNNKMTQEIHDLLVKNGFIKTVASLKTRVTIQWGLFTVIIAGLIGLWYKAV